MRFLLTIILCWSGICGMVHAAGLSFSLNGVSAIEDQVNQVFYLSVLPSEGEDESLQAVFSWNDGAGLDSICWDGQALTTGEEIAIGSWREIHEVCIYPSGKTPEKWKAVLTPLPVVEMNLEPDAPISGEISALGTLQIADAQKRTGGLANFLTDVKAHYRGATASLFEKKSYSLTLLDVYGEKRDASLLGIRMDDKWILDAMAVDVSRMRNRLCFDLWNEISEKTGNKMLRNGTEGYHVELVLNHAYHGLYCLSDKVNRKLLGLKKNKSDDDEVRGCLYKCKRADTPTHFLKLPDEELDTDGMWWGDWELKYPSENQYEDTYSPLINLITFTDGVATDSAYVDKHLYDYFYEGNLVTYPVFAFSTLLLDNMMHNTYLSFPDAQDDERAWITPWDLDGSFGRDGMGIRCDWLATPRYIFQETEPYHTLFENPNSRLSRDMAERWKELRNGALSIDHVFACIDAYATLLQTSGAWTRERERWNVNPQELEETPETETSYMKAWYARNYHHLDQLFTNIVSGIDDVRGGEGSPEKIYTIDGRPIEDVTDSRQLQPGVYIRNGKKIIK